MPKHQSKIEKLIEELCPDGVEYSSISELCFINRGKVISKDYLKDNAGIYPVYSSQTENSGIFGNINTYDYDGEFVTWTTDGANAGSIFYRKGRFSITNVCGLLKPKLEILQTKFLSYILSITAKDYVNSGMGNPKLMSNAMSQIIIPVPPMEVQEEIVSILDKFTQLEAELEAELKSRRLQYNHYKEMVLSEDSENITILGDLCENIVSGKNKFKSVLGDYPVYGSTGIIGFSDDYCYEGDSLLIARVGANAGYVYKASGFYDVSDNTLILKPKEGYDLSYAFHQLTYLKLNNYAVGGGQPLITASLLRNLRIPLPPLTRQKQVSSILDKFEALVNDISVGLPAELAARRKQYEHYRNKLLTFGEKDGRK